MHISFVDMCKKHTHCEPPPYIAIVNNEGTNEHDKQAKGTRATSMPTCIDPKNILSRTKQAGGAPLAACIHNSTRISSIVSPSYQAGNNKTRGCTHAPGIHIKLFSKVEREILQEHDDIISRFICASISCNAL